MITNEILLLNHLQVPKETTFNSRRIMRAMSVHSQRDSRSASMRTSVRNITIVNASTVLPKKCQVEGAVKVINRKSKRLKRFEAHCSGTNAWLRLEHLPKTKLINEDHTATSHALVKQARPVSSLTSLEALDQCMPPLSARSMPGACARDAVLNARQMASLAQSLRQRVSPRHANTSCLRGIGTLTLPTHRSALMVASPELLLLRRVWVGQGA